MKKSVFKILTITCILSVYGYSNSKILNNMNANVTLLESATNTNSTTNTDSNTNATMSDEELLFLEGEVRVLLEKINSILRAANGLYTYELKDEVDPIISQYNEKRDQLIKELDKLPADDKRKNNINMYPDKLKVFVNDYNRNGIKDIDEYNEYNRLIDEINGKKRELDEKIEELKIVSPEKKKEIENEINELNKTIKETKEKVKNLTRVDVSENYPLERRQLDILHETYNDMEEYNNSVTVNDVDSNDKIDDEELGDSKNKLDELDNLEENINNSENNLGDVISQTDKEKIDKEKTEYNEKLDMYKIDINSLSDLINGSKDLKDRINSKKELDLSTVVANDVDNNGKKDSEEVDFIKDKFVDIKDKIDEIDILNNIGRILTRDEKSNINQKIEEYNTAKKEIKDLIDDLNEKIAEKDALLKEFLELKNFEKHDVNKVESEIVREKLDEKLKDLEELLEYIEANKEKINNKIDEVKSKEIQMYDELDSYLNHLDIFVKDEYISILDKVKENIDIIKKTIDYIKADEKIKKELDEKLSKEHINFTKEEFKKYYVELKDVVKNLDGNLIDSAKYAYAFLYDDVSIKDRFDENYYFKVNLGTSIKSLLTTFVNKDKIYAKHILNNVQLGFNKKIDDTTNLKVGAFIEYSNDITNNISFGLNLKNKYLTLFGRYRLSILDKGVLNNKDVIFNNNLDLYISSDYVYKFKNLEIRPKVGIYLVASFNTKLENDIVLKSRVYGGLEFSNKLIYSINDYRIYNDLSLKGFYNDLVLKKGNKQLETLNKFYLAYNAVFGFDKKVYDKLRVGASVELNGRYDVHYGISNNNINLKFATNVSYLFE